MGWGAVARTVTVAEARTLLAVFCEHHGAGGHHGPVFHDGSVEHEQLFAVLGYQLGVIGAGGDRGNGSIKREGKRRHRRIGEG
jgi:hypothetical protein